MKNPKDMNEQELRDYVAKLEADKAAQANRKLTLKVSEKGGLSVYGLGRFPVTLYREQWEKLHAAMPEIESFIAANADKLTTKAEAKSAQF